MTDQILTKIYQRIRDYSTIRELAVDTPKISNAAYEEMTKSFLELIYKFDGNDFIKQQLLLENNEILKLTISVFLLTVDKDFALLRIKDLSNSQIQRVKESAMNIVTEKYNTVSELIDSYEIHLNKIRVKYKI